MIPNTVHIRSISLYQAAVCRSGMGLGPRNFCQNVGLSEVLGGPAGFVSRGEENKRCLVVVEPRCKVGAQNVRAFAKNDRAPWNPMHEEGAPILAAIAPL